MNFLPLQKNVVDCQLEPNGIMSEEILDLFASTPRHAFVPESCAQKVYIDEDVEIIPGRWSLSPLTEARLIEAAQPNPHDTVLVVGAASPVMIAVLSQLVQTVFVVEPEQKLCDQLQKALEKQDIGSVVLHKGDLNKGFEGNAPYSKVIFSAAVADVDAFWKSQIAEDGQVVAVVRMSVKAPGALTLFSSVGMQKGKRSHFISQENCPYLTGFEPQKCFSL